MSLVARLMVIVAAVGMGPIAAARMGAVHSAPSSGEFRALSTECDDGTTPSPSPSPSPTGPIPTVPPAPTVPPLPGESPSPTPTPPPPPPPPKTCETEVTLKFGKRGFSGALRSDDQGCVSRRQVSLVLDRKKDSEIADTLTSDSGRYKFPVKRKAVEGKKFYTETPRIMAADGENTTCNEARSKVVKP